MSSLGACEDEILESSMLATTTTEICSLPRPTSFQDIEHRPCVSRVNPLE
jgi:hypothetical protein